MTAIPTENVNYNHIHYFHLVAETGSVSAAARRLGVTKPTVSAQLRQLEEFLGESLFDRRGGRLHLNAAGRVAYRHSRKMFDATDSLLRHFRGMHVEQAATLRVGVATSVSRSLASDFFVPLMEMESVRPSIKIAEARVLQRELLSIDVDLVVTDVVPPNPDSLGLKAELLDRTPLVLVGSPGLVKQGTSVPDVLAEHSLVQYLPETTYRWQLEEYIQRQGVEVTVGAYSNDIPTIVSLVAAGECVAVVPSPAAEALVKVDRLEIIGSLQGTEALAHAIYLARDLPSVVRQGVTRLKRISNGKGKRNGASKSNGASKPSANGSPKHPVAEEE